MLPDRTLHSGSLQLPDHVLQTARATLLNSEVASVPPSMSNLSHMQKSKLRIDSFLSANLPAVSRSRIKDCIQGGRVLVNSTPRLKAAQALKAGDAVSCALPAPRISAAIPEDIPIDIVYEDDSVIVVNKPAGLILNRLIRFMRPRWLVTRAILHCKSRHASL